MAGEKQLLLKIYKLLLDEFGPQNWWPAKTRQEVIFGAILTQSITWRNVEQALTALRSHGKLNFRAVDEMEPEDLAPLIKPARFLNQKAKALKGFAQYFGKNYAYSINKMKEKDLPFLRNELLSLYRIGPETADSILLYALDKPVFVIDVYTRRIFSCHGLMDKAATYEQFQNLFMKHLPGDVNLFNEYHALIVCLGNRLCKPKPLCSKCPLKNLKQGIQTSRAFSK